MLAMRKVMTLGSVALMFVILSACGTYYKITDPASGKIFYTTDYDKDRSGAISFEDTRSKSKVTLQSSEISEIGSDEYDKAVGSD